MLTLSLGQPLCGDCFPYIYNNMIVQSVQYKVHEKGTINVHYVQPFMLDTIDTLYAKYNTLLYENGYGQKYNLGEAWMFMIEGMEKVRKVIEENRRRKLTKHKKIPNDTIIEIDNCSPLEILKLQRNLMQIAEGEGILFVSQKGTHKPEIQKLQDHEKRKTRAYREDIGKYYNMTYAVFEDEHYYICHDGRELRPKIDIAKRRRQSGKNPEP